MIYIIIILLILPFSLYELVFGKSCNRAIKIFSIVLLILLTGFRYDAGNDFFNYVRIFNNINEYSPHLESLFVLLCKALQSVGLGVQMLFLICSILTVIPLVYVLNKRYSSFFFTGLLFYIISFVFFESWNTIRQAVAMSFLVLAVHFFNCARETYNIRSFYIKSSICVLVAFLFHKSSIIIVPFLLWIIYRGHLKFSSLILLGAIIISYIIGHYFSGIFNYIQNFLPGMYADSKYLDEIEQRGVSSGVYQLYLCLSASWLVLYWKYRKVSVQYSQYFTQLVLIYVVGVCLYNVFMEFYIGLRFYWYLYVFIMFLFPELFKNVWKKDKWALYLPFILVLSLYTYKSLQTEYYINADVNFNIFSTY